MKKLSKHFFTFEGGEGAGKSTVSSLVVEKLKDEGYDIMLTREPGGKDLPFSEKIREIIFENDDISPYTELFLFEASRREHFEKIILPNLKEGKIVICDRFTDSTLVYQKLKGVKLKDIKILNKIATDKFHPNKTFIFDIDPEISLKRISDNKNREINKFEKASLDYHQKVREEYINLAKRNIEKYVLINANRSIENVVDDISNLIKENLEKNVLPH